MIVDAEIREAVQNYPLMFSERDILKLVEEPLERLKAAPQEERLAFVFDAFRKMPEAESLQVRSALKGMSASLLRSGVKLSTVDAVKLVEAVSFRHQVFPFRAVLNAIETVPRTAALLEAVSRLRYCIDEWHGGPEMRELHERIDAIIYGKRTAPLEGAAAWSQKVFSEIDIHPAAQDWRLLMSHARSLTQSVPAKKWQQEAVKRVDAIGKERVLEAARRWLAIGPTPGDTQLQTPDAEADYQKGFLWTLGAMGDPSIAPDIADFAFACFRKIPMIGAVSHRVGNACVGALGAMPGLDAVSQISRLGARVRYDVARRLIEKALVEAAAKNGVSREDLEAMSVPSFGLNETGARIEAAGDCEARLAIANGAAFLSWSREGKTLKSMPASVKQDHADLAAELKKAAKELDGVLGTQRIRLERQLLSQDTCRFDRWMEWYIEHPVVSHFARRLIWEIGEQTAIWHDGKLVDWAGAEVKPPSDASVRLWHPIRAEVQTILSWRCWLEDHDVRQPFKQAHREVYLLTDAERQTEIYSNRFAAHIIKQHPFAALCRERGWQFNLMGQWNSHNTPYLELPQYKLRVEFDVDFANEEEISGHAIYLTIATAQVRFMPMGEEKKRHFDIRNLANYPFNLAELQAALPQPLGLETIPAVVFSEVMRDCDLFVGVTSIGADPAWNAEQGHSDYWHAFATGELSIAAENRKAILESLLPKLAIRDRCRIEGRFLIVRGELHEYRIHIGSGNIIVEPGSRYLCIVQGAGDSNVRLPFEGDRMLAIVLSKAFLLVEDSKIKDETIRRQIAF